MAQEYDGHLTTEQLSAFLDKQFSAQEQIEWNAHLRTCQQCQRRLADLRQTVVLLHALPQVELPRSFVLPASTRLAPEHRIQTVQKGAAVGERGGRVMPIAHDRPRNRSALQRSVRVLSTIAAVVGFLLIASGLLVGAHIGGGGTYASNTASGGASQVTAGSAASSPQNLPRQPSQHATVSPVKPGAAAPQVTRTPSQIVKSAPSPTHAHDHNVSLPPVLDLSTPVGLEGVGLILLVLGFLGLTVMRVVRRRAVRT